MTLREYLSQEAHRITDRSLADIVDAAAWRNLLPERRRRFLEMMGLDNLSPYEQRPPLNVTVTGVVERPTYHIEKLYYESLPQLYVTANLYMPKRALGVEPDPPSPRLRGALNAASPRVRGVRGVTLGVENPPEETRAEEGRGNPNAQRLTPNALLPGVLYVCGHSATQKVHYQAHPRRFAELGFACLVVETIQLGEVRGYHHGCCREGWWHWYSRGYTPAGVELLNGIRGLDLLAQRAEVDPQRLGVTGISGGGAVSWYVAAGDERVKVAAPVCGTATLASHISDRTIDGHCDCMWWTNTYQWDLADVGALIAPRPLLIASADRDEIFTIASIRKVHAQLHRLYGDLEAQENLRLVETPGGHSYHERSRTAIFSLFLKHLQGVEVAPETVGDVDEAPEHQDSEDTLRVFLNGPLAEDRTRTIQETFITRPDPPQIASVSDLDRTRREVVAALREQTFRAFPAEPPPLDVKVEFEFQSDSDYAGCRFAYTSEHGWRLHGRIQLGEAIARPAPAVVALRLPEEERWTTEGFLGRIRAPWAKTIVETRGTGDTVWGQQLQWHLRRAAAWTGRTIASMRVWDTLRALEAVRTLPDVDGSRVSLAAQGEMAVIALYAALLDGRVATLFLQSPPATQNAPSRPDGKGEAIEMLNCLRITDLPQVAGLLYPTEIVLVGNCPETYAWAEDLYRALGAPSRFQRVAELADWRPESAATA